MYSKGSQLYMYDINFLHLKNSDSFFKLRKFMTNTLIQKQFKIDFFSYLSHIYTYIRIIVAMCAGIWICYSSVCVCVCVCMCARARAHVFAFLWFCHLYWLFHLYCGNLKKIWPKLPIAPVFYILKL